MPNVAHLLSTPMDDPSLQIPLCPVGTWKGELVKISVSAEDREGNALTTKNGDPFSLVRLLFRPTEPLEDVDKKEGKAWLEAGGPDETVIGFTQFIMRKRDVAKVGRLFESIGVPWKGRGLEAVASEYKGGVVCLAEVTHRELDDGDVREDITALYADN